MQALLSGTDDSQLVHGKCTWKTANIEMSILSTHELASNNKEIRYRENDGDIIDLNTGEITRFIVLSGVYVCKVWMPTTITQGKCKEHPDFDRQDP